MFWTQTLGDKFPKVLKSAMYGGQQVVMVTSNLSWPFGITLDRRSKFAFWMNHITGAIESSDYNGNNRRFFAFAWRRKYNFYGVTFSSSYLFVTDFGGNGFKVDASNGTVQSNFSINFKYNMGIVAFNSYLQPPGL